MSLIDGIYDALDDDLAYAALPRMLADAVGARSATLQVIAGGAPLEVASAYFSPEMNGYYLDREVFKFDIWNSLSVDHARFDCARTSDDVMSRRQFADSAFYNDFFRVFGDDTGVCLGGVVRMDGGHIGLGLQRGITAPEYTPADVARIDQALPHLRRVVELRRRFAGVEAGAASLRGVLDAMVHAVLVTDASGRLLFANAAAEALLKAGAVLKMRAGHIIAPEPAAQNELGLLVANAASARAGRGGALALAKPDGGAPYRLLVAPHRLGEFSTGALILVDDPDDRPSNVAEIARALYGLTPAEACLAERLARGDTLQEAAVSREVALGTVQSQLKAIRAKTDTRRQAELVSLLSSLPRLPPR